LLVSDDEMSKEEQKAKSKKQDLTPKGICNGKSVWIKSL
jgi:hypothetical protein